MSADDDWDQLARLIGEGFHGESTWDEQLDEGARRVWQGIADAVWAAGWRPDTDDAIAGCGHYCAVCASKARADVILALYRDGEVALLRDDDDERRADSERDARRGH